MCLHVYVRIYECMWEHISACICMCVWEHMSSVDTHAMLPMWMSVAECVNRFTQLQNVLTDTTHIHAEDMCVFLACSTHATLITKEVNLRNAPSRAWCSYCPHLGVRDTESGSKPTLTTGKAASWAKHATGSPCDFQVLYFLQGTQTWVATCHWSWSV